MAGTQTDRPAAPPERRRRRSGLTLRQRENRAGLAFLSPTFVVVTAVVILPILWTVMLAFQRIRLINIRQAGLFSAYTLDNFTTVLASPGFWGSLWTTLVFTVGATGVSIGLGLVAALALRRPFRGRTAARVDGATLTQRFRHVLLPQLGPVIALLCVLRFIMTFTKFDDVYLLTGGGAGTDVVSVRVYEFLTARFDIGAAAAQALVLALVLVVLLTIYLRFFAPRVEEVD